MNVDLNSFYNVLSSLKQNEYIFQKNDGTFGTTSRDQKHLSTEEITKIANQCLDTWRSSSEQDTKRKPSENKTRLEKALKAYQVRVSTSIENRWWYCIAKFFGWTFEMPKSFKDLMDRFNPSPPAPGPLKIESDNKSENEVILDSLRAELATDPSVQNDPDPSDITTEYDEQDLQADLEYMSYHKIVSEGPERRRTQVENHKKLISLQQICLEMIKYRCLGEFVISNYDLREGFSDKDVLKAYEGLSMDFKTHWIPGKPMALRDLHISVLPDVINEVDIKSLHIKNCPNLISLPPLSIKGLEMIDLQRLQNFRNFPDVSGCKNLQTLMVDFCPNLKLLPPQRILPMRVSTIMFSQTPLTRLPNWIGEMNNLITLSISKTKITKLPESFFGLKILKQLNWQVAPGLKELPKYLVLMPNLTGVNAVGNHLKKKPPEFNLNPKLEVFL